MDHRYVLVDEALACCCCHEPYDLGEHLPLELQCTHVLCEACLHTLAPLICPICRRGYASEKEAVFGVVALPKDALEAEAAVARTCMVCGEVENEIKDHKLVKDLAPNSGPLLCPPALTSALRLLQCVRATHLFTMLSGQPPGS